MPIQLDTAVDVGDLTTKTMDHAMVWLQRHDGKRSTISLEVEYGTIVADEWNPSGLNPAEESDFPTYGEISDTQYNDIIANSVPDVQTSDPGDAVRYAQVGAVWVERTYYAVKRGIYEWLQAQHTVLAGTIV